MYVLQTTTGQVTGHHSKLLSQTHPLSATLTLHMYKVRAFLDIFIYPGEIIPRFQEYRRLLMSK